MKKGLLLFVCAIALATVTNAQVRFGFKAGANLANLVGDDADGDMKIGFNAGALAKISISESFSIQPELVFSAQGTKEDAGDDDLKTNLGYINLPILAQYNTSGFTIETGPQVGFLISKKFKLGSESMDIPDDVVKGLDISWAIGAGYLTQSGFGVNARFNLGLSNISENEDAKIKNSVIQIGVFYLLGGGGSAKK